MPSHEYTCRRAGLIFRHRLQPFLTDQRCRPSCRAPPWLWPVVPLAVVLTLGDIPIRDLLSKEC